MQSRAGGEVLRQVMRRVPSPVTIVTVRGKKEMRGITIGSFASTSLHPPLISFNVNRSATIYEALTTGDRFVVHVLSDEQAHLSDHFATPDLEEEEQFEGVAYRLDAGGIPILLDAVAVIHCERYAVYDAGDHSIVVGRVVDVDTNANGSPIVYFDRTYRRVGKEVQSAVYEPVDDGPASS